MNLTFGSLFAGIGGFDLGFERAGMACKWQVEIDDYANRVLAKHWPAVHRERDIRQCGKHNLEAVDVICGGFPCQDISYAGLGAGLDGERSGLFFEAVRVVRELRPRVVVLENVAALLTRGLDRVLGTLAEIGYDAEWHCIPAAAVGAPHIRDRVFVIAYANSERLERPKHERERLSFLQRTGDVCEDVANAGGWRWREELPESFDRGSSEDTDLDELPESEASGRRDIPRIFAGASGLCGRRHQWEIEPAVGRVADGVSNRVDRLRGLGNAVVPQVAEFIGQRIVRAILEEER